MNNPTALELLQNAIKIQMEISREVIDLVGALGAVIERESDPDIKGRLTEIAEKFIGVGKKTVTSARDTGRLAIHLVRDRNAA